MAMCRVCLQSGVKMHVLSDSRLEEMFEILTDDKISTDDGRPQTFCYICCSQLQKCRRFLDTFHRTAKVVNGLARSGVEMTAKTISICNQKMPRNFIVTPTVTETVPQSSVSVKDEAKKESEVEAIVKNELQETVDNSRLDDEEIKDAPAAKKAKNEENMQSAKMTFACDQCDKSFKLKIQLNGHKRVHGQKQKKQQH